MPRKLPFSAKRKKQQLRDRRERKRGDAPAGPAPGPGSRSGSRERGGDGPPGDPPSEPPRRHDPGRFRLQLGGPRAEALERSRRRAQQELLELLPESALELDPDGLYGPGLDFPRRPPWSFGMSPEELRAREEAAFGAFLRGLGDGAGLAPFEHNLETWRQLWRVLEMSDIVLLIADARHPALGVPPALAAHVTRDLGKGLILILNKVDLAPPAVATAWSHLLRARHGPARVVPFSTAPGPPAGPGLQKRQRKRGGRWGRAVGPRLLLEACEELVGGAVDLSSWRARLERAEQRPDGDDDEEEEEEEPPGGAGDEEDEGAGPGGVAPPRQWERYRHGVLTLGCVGLPNAGKSSVLNAVLGRGAVGVSRAPGRTRYFQTHFLTASVRLCDCPGLVFPSRAPPELQVLAGAYLNPVPRFPPHRSWQGCTPLSLSFPRSRQGCTPLSLSPRSWQGCTPILYPIISLIPQVLAGLYPIISVPAGPGRAVPQSRPPLSLSFPRSWQGCTPLSLSLQVLAGLYPVISLVPQVLAGVYPIAQLQDPYSAVGFLGSRLALPPLLQLRPPGGRGWTAWELCEAWAEKRGYKTARAARNDVARAANGLLRLAAEGRLRLCFRPPGYSREKELWELHPDTAALAAMTGGGATAPPPTGAASSSEEDEGEESDQATPPPSPAPNPFAWLGEDEC
ncbi:guanine nucleotide-binding protein-like 1 isoform X1 [Anomalospiza imberbis]|uniref:guanine nucleotide-binding protein-like 1 isoform X1 n=1 Tax=Anomalospiza imberbis TaxID=187417 RepID=UPI00358F9A2E